MKKKIVHRTKNVITIDSDIAKRYRDLTIKINKLQKELEPIETQLKTELLNSMEEIGETKVNSNGINASLKKAYIQNKFDTTKFKEENTILYDKYVKAINISASLSLKVEG